MSVKRAVTWSAVDRVGQQALSLVVSIVLARLLGPAEFGLIAMIGVFLTLGGIVADGGFGYALIQRPVVTQAERCSVFFFSLAMAAAMVVVLWLLAGPIARFYGQPLLAVIIPVLSARVFISALGAVQVAVLAREMNFRKTALANSTATLVGGLVGISMAYTGQGVWSLVGQALSAACVATALLWLLQPWRPSLVFEAAALKRMWGYGSRMMASNMIDSVFQNSFTVVIGKQYSAHELGLFSRAQTLALLPARVLYQTLGRVTFPWFSKMQANPDQLKQQFRRVIRLSCLLHFPTMALLAAAAPEAVIGVLTEKWAGSIPYLQVLCLVGLMYPLQASNLSVVQALGHSGLFLKLEIARKSSLLLVLLLTFQWGVLVMAWGLVVQALIAYVLNTTGTRRDLGYRWREQGRDILPSLCCAAVAGATAWSIGLVSHHNLWAVLAAKLTIGGLVYGLLILLGRRRIFAEEWVTVSVPARRALGDLRRVVGLA